MNPKSPAKSKPSAVRPSKKNVKQTLQKSSPPSSPINVKTKGLLCEDDGSVQDTSMAGSDTFSFAADNHKLFGKKTKTKFKNLTKLLPDYKIDLKLQLSIISTLKELNCWSDDEDDNLSEDAHLPMPTISLPMFSPQAVKAAKMKLNERVVEDDNSIMDRLLQDLNNAEGQGSVGDNSTVSSYNNSPTSPLKRKQFKPPRVDTSTFNNVPFILPESPVQMKSMRRVSMMEIKAKTTTPRADFQSSRDQIRNRILTKAVQLLADKHVEKKEFEKRERLKEQMYGTEAYRMTVISKFSVVVSKIVTDAALKRVSDKMNRCRVRAANRLAKESQAIAVLNTAWRNYRLRKLWSGILVLINRNLVLKKEEEVRDECAYRIRAAYRRVREDMEFKTYTQARATRLGVPLTESCLVKILTPTAPIDPPPSKEDGNMSTESLRKPEHTISPRRTVVSNLSTSILSSPSVAAIRASSAVSISTGNNKNKKPFMFPFVKTKPRQVTDFEYARPDLAPFSTHINAAIQAATLFKREETWEELAAVDEAYVARIKAGTNKSAAYRALQQLCGLSEHDILSRKSELGPEYSSKRQFRTGGSSILSL